MKKICVVGNLNFGKEDHNGQTVKSRIIYDELTAQFGSGEVSVIDTAGGMKRVPVIVLKFIKAFFENGNIIIMPASNGVRVFAPLCALLGRALKKKTHYVVIGGWLPQLASQKPVIKKSILRIDALYVEDGQMAEALKKLGCENTYVMPNFKRLTIPDEPAQSKESDCFRLCTFSRVSTDKGITEAVSAVRMLNEKNKGKIFKLDIYGQVQRDQDGWFGELKKTFDENITYKGCVRFSESPKVLREYDALLFPTYYEGEGFAGTLIDAFAAGLPVIATDWKYNGNIITDGVNGLLVKPGDTESLKNGIERLFENDAVRIQIGLNNLKKAENYLPENVMPILTGNLL